MQFWPVVITLYDLDSKAWPILVLLVTLYLDPTHFLWNPTIDKNSLSPSSKQVAARTAIALFGSSLSTNYQTNLLDAAVRAAREQAVNLVAYSLAVNVGSTID